MVFGNPENKIIMFNNKEIECVNKYKYLGVMINSVKRCNGDIFREHSNYIKEKSNKAIFALANKTKSFGKLDHIVSLYLFDCFVKPILTYGSDAWEYNDLIHRSQN